ncbi:ABC transporter substrate-binding protein [uncultured Roseibium sp.]|uniref:ABC transporter substrate-binding protein n=1 Tax=uncultured Roseibium sp. TaxID=1936171 RepID=UPI002602B8FE|nr:ABC transporter substrate-binding protein [uncultured Roseibium sp.]
MKYTRLIGAFMLSAAFTAPAAAQEIRFMCNDEPFCKVLDDLFTGFEAENPGVDVVTDIVSYDVVLKNLPVQLAAGEGPDMARVTDLGGLNEYYIDLAPYVDRGYWEDSFGDTLDWYRVGADDDGIYGMHGDFTITGAYINKTLFDQAGVEIPSADADWDTWAQAATAVAEATGIEAAMAMDRSGHRIAGPAISYGARIFDENGEPILVDDAFQEYVQKFVDWNNDGVMLRDVWAGAGGGSYRDAGAEFINGTLAYLFSGSWQTLNFDQKIGDLFDWQVVGSPCGAGGCSGMPGGSGIVGFKHTKHPELVAKLIDYLAQQDVYAELTSRTRSVPAHYGVAAAGVDYQDVSAPAAAALNAWGAQVEKLSPIAFAYQGYKNNRAMFNITVQRVTQAVVGEYSVDEAMERARDDLATVLAETAK